jgi:hypothetical protein
MSMNIPTGRYRFANAENIIDGGQLEGYIISGKKDRGTQLTKQLAQRFGKAHVVVDLDRAPAITSIVQWAVTKKIGVLNVAGPRVTRSSDCYEKGRMFMQAFLKADSFQNRPGRNLL